MTPNQRWYRQLLSDAGLEPAIGISIGSSAYERKLAVFRARNSKARKEQVRLREIERNARRSRRFSRSRKILAMRKSAAERKAAGFRRMNEPTCLCGNCPLCKQRERARRARAERKAPVFYWDHPEPAPGIFDLELAAITARVR